MASELGVASSIIGIFGLAGETIKASSKLYIFCKAYRSLDIWFENIGKELGDLENDVRRIEATAKVVATDASF